MMRAAFPTLLLVLAWGCSQQPSPPPKQGPPPPEPLKITQFYVSPSVIDRGDKVMLCYGVEHARAVELQPPVEPIDPSPNRCIQFAPARTTTYTLIATGVGGKSERQTTTVTVGPARPPQPAPERLIRAFASSAGETQPGTPVTLCYSVARADAISLEPAPGQIGPERTKCVIVTPKSTTTYTLRVRAGTISEQATATVRVLPAK